jgi:hypothetical protein
MMSLKQQIKQKSLMNIFYIKKDFNNNDDSVSPVGHGSHVYYNSVNVMVGAQGSHKTTQALSETALISQIPEAGCHCVLYFKKKEYDATLEGFRDQIKCPIVEQPFENAEEYCKTFFKAKKLYNRLRREGKLNEIDNLVEDPDDFREYLKINNETPSRGKLTTVLILEDAGNSTILKKKDGYFDNVFKLCRELGIIVFICIHGFNQISVHLKENSAVFFIAKGLSDERLNLISYHTNNGIDHKEFLNAYHDMASISGASFLVVDTLRGSLGIE